MSFFLCMASVWLGASGLSIIGIRFCCGRPFFGRAIYCAMQKLNCAASPYLTPFGGRTTMGPVMPEPSPRRYLFPGLLVCFFLSGAAGLIDQVVWSKALGLIFGHTAYAVATVLAVFMAGLASGSAWIGRRGERWGRPIALYGGLELGVAATAAISLAGLAGVRTAYVAVYPYVAGNASALLTLRFVGSALVL